MTMQPLWQPSRDRMESSNMLAYMRWLISARGIRIDDAHGLYEWSISNIGTFWESIWEFCGVVASQKYSEPVAGSTILTARWFEGARLNFAENLLRHSDTHTAIVAVDESGVRDRITYAELRIRVARMAAALRGAGVVKGDRVAGYLPNIPEAVIAMLAATSIGAIWSSCSPDFGLQGVLDRFSQISPKVLVACNGYCYHGKTFDCRDRASGIARAIGSIERVVIVPVVEGMPIARDDRFITWSDFVDCMASDIVFEQLPFDHPVYIMYSSGTTGIPKCIVHGAGGTLLQHLKELILHTDVKRSDTIAYYTTCGWMMWNWLVSSLAVGAAVVLIDGSPAFPETDGLFRHAEEVNITVLGTSPKYLSACQSAGTSPIDSRKLPHLKTILSTGSPLSIENFRWVYDKVKPDVQLASISGGTDIISCFMLGHPLLPVYAGEIQSRGLGMSVDVFDDNGMPVRECVGELVCTAPFPSRPIYFWNDPETFKYRAAYFEHFPDIWRHGDYVKLTERGGMIVYGRSDATLNPGGVRIGTAEIYAPVESMPEIEDSIVIGQRWQNDIRIVLFVVPKDGTEFTDDLRDRIRRRIREAETPRHVPSKIIAVREIPRTISGKKVEMAVAHMVHGEEVANRDALANPHALDQFADIAELRQ